MVVSTKTLDTARDRSLLFQRQGTSSRASSIAHWIAVCTVTSVMIYWSHVSSSDLALYTLEIKEAAPPGWHVEFAVTNTWHGGYSSLINLVFDKQGGPRDSWKERKKKRNAYTNLFFFFKPSPSTLAYKKLLLSRHLNLDAANVAYVW